MQSSLEYQALYHERMARIAGRRYAQRTGDSTEVKVYSNQDSVMLYLNAKFIRSKK